jgi:general stress protein 26
VTGSNLNAVNNGGVIAPWGGMNSFTYTQSTRDQYFANTKSYKLLTGYDFKNLTSYDFEASVSHARYMIGTENDYVPSTTWNAKETDLDIKYNVESVKNLQVWLRSNYQRNFAPATTTINTVNNNEYRLEVNYKF